MLSIPTVRSALICCDQLHPVDNPLNSYAKLDCFIKKARSADLIEWCILLIIDFVESGALRADQIGLRALQGMGKSKGLVDLLLFKRSLHQHLISKTMESLPFDVDIKLKIREITSSIPVYRAAYGYSYTDKFPATRSFMAGWPKAADKFLGLLDASVFSYEFDEAFRGALKGGKDVSTIM